MSGADRFARYDAFWAKFFGVEPERLRTAGISVVPHAELGEYPGIWFFARGSSRVVSAPPAWLPALRARAAQLDAAGLPDAALLRDLLGGEPQHVIGPTYQGCLLPGAFRPARDRRVRPLERSDEPAVEALHAAALAQEWDHSGLSGAVEPKLGLFVDGVLVALGGLEGWSADAANPGVLSHPQHRGRGYARAVLSAVVELGLAEGKVVLYQTLLENHAAVAIANRLGFEHYASQLAVRLEHGDPAAAQ